MKALDLFARFPGDGLAGENACGLSFDGGRRCAAASRLQPRNRRYLGNKYKLLDFIEGIVKEKCGNFGVFCDMFAGTGVVAHRFNRPDVAVIANDILTSNYIALKAFLGATTTGVSEITRKIRMLDELEANEDNYFSRHFGGTYFTVENARKIGAVREKIDELAADDSEKALLVTSLLYAADKAANTVGHYDAFRKTLDTTRPLRLLPPDFSAANNVNNRVYNEDANSLIEEIECDVLYLDPPYNSRQYSDAYHLLENLATWKKPPVYGKAKKMSRLRVKSRYCLHAADKALAHLISRARCGHILLSYNNTGDSKDGRSNARISDETIMRILRGRGKVEVFEQGHKAFTAGKSDASGHAERVFYCEVAKR